MINHSGGMGHHHPENYFPLMILFISLVRIHPIKVLKQSLQTTVFDLISLSPKLSN